MVKHVAVDVMSAADFAAGVKLNKFTLHRHKMGDNHPLKVINNLLAGYHKVEKWKYEDRYGVLADIVRKIKEYMGTKDPLKTHSKKSKYRTLRLLQEQATLRPALEELRMKELHEEMTAPKKAGAVRVGEGHDNMYERLNKAGAPAIEGQELVDLARVRLGVELTDDPEKNWFMMKKVLKYVHDHANEILPHVRGQMRTNKTFGDMLNMIYMDPDTELPNYLVEVDVENNPTQLLYQGEPLTTKEGQQPAVIAWPYATSTAGLFYAVFEEHFREMGTRTPVVHHSSFLSGKDALCAGCIKVNQGRLIEIDNNSGHYKPKLDALARACEALVDAGYDPGNDGYVILYDHEGKFGPKNPNSPLPCRMYRFKMSEVVGAEPSAQVAHAAEVEPGGDRWNPTWTYLNEKEAKARGYK